GLVGGGMPGHHGDGANVAPDRRRLRHMRRIADGQPARTRQSAPRNKAPQHRRMADHAGNALVIPAGGTVDLPAAPSSWRTWPHAHQGNGSRKKDLPQPVMAGAPT